MDQAWSWLLTAVGVFGLYLAGRRNRAGWAVGLGAQSLWLTYAITTRQWGFIVSAGAYGWVYARNWLRWRNERTAPHPGGEAAREAPPKAPNDLAAEPGPVPKGGE